MIEKEERGLAAKRGKSGPLAAKRADLAAEHEVRCRDIEDPTTVAASILRA